MVELLPLESANQALDGIRSGASEGSPYSPFDGVLERDGAAGKRWKIGQFNGSRRVPFPGKNGLPPPRTTGGD